MTLSQAELTKVRKASLLADELSSEQKSTVIDSKLREMCSEIKKHLARKDATIEIYVMKGTN